MKTDRKTQCYAFLAHPPELKDVARKYPLARIIPRFILDRLIRVLPPLIGSRITGFRMPDGKEAGGWVVLCPLTAQQIMDHPGLARKKVLATVLLAERLNCKLIGLGAFSSIATDGGLYLADKVQIGLTSGNAYAAALAIENLSLAVEKIGKNLKESVVAVIGAAGSVGSACSQILYSRVKKIILIDKRESELKDLIEANDLRKAEARSDLPEPVKADAIVTVTSAAKGMLGSQHIPAGAVVIDCAQPHNVADEVVFSRDDIIVINSGIAKLEGINLNMDVGLRKDEVYACLGETLILMWRGWEGHYSLGQVKPAHVEEILVHAPKVGLRVADFRNVNGLLQEADFERVRSHTGGRGGEASLQKMYS